MIARCVVVLACLLVAAPAIAQKRDRRGDARTHYENGRRKFDQGKYGEAAEEFVAAYEIVGEPPNLLYNIAQAYRLADQYDKAAEYYRSFLRKAPDVGNRAEIEGRIQEMDERAAEAKREADRRSAEERDTLVRSGTKARRAEEAREAPKGYEPPPRDGGATEEQKAHPGRALKIVGGALCVLSAGSLAWGIAMSALAAKQSQTVEDAATRGGAFDQSLHDTESKGQLYDKLQIVGYSIAGAAAVGGALAIYFGFRAEQQAKWDSTTPVSARRRLLARPMIAPTVSPTVSIDGGGLSVMGHF